MSFEKEFGSAVCRLQFTLIVTTSAENASEWGWFKIPNIFSIGCRRISKEIVEPRVGPMQPGSKSEYVLVHCGVGGWKLKNWVCYCQISGGAPRHWELLTKLTTALAETWNMKLRQGLLMFPIFGVIWQKPSHTLWSSSDVRAYWCWLWTTVLYLCAL